MFSPAKKAFASSLVTVLMASATALFSTGAEAVPLPTPDCGAGPTNNCLTFNDFNVYSLPLLQLRESGSSVPGPGDTYFAPATYGAIKNDTIVGINNGNSTDTGNPPGGTDGSYDTPSPNNDTSGTFSTRSTDDPNTSGGAPTDAEFFGDEPGSWDATTSAILSLTNNTPVVFFFAFNETGSGSGLETTDLLIWGLVTLVDQETGNTIEFFLGGENGPGGMFSSTYTPLDDPLPPASGTNTNFGDPGYDFGPWIYVHAGICADDDGNFLGVPDSSGQCAFGTVRNQNDLGQNAAAFMVNSPALDAALLSGTWDAMQITWEMAYINGGGETAWIMPAEGGDNRVPEPHVLGLVAMALLAVGVMRHRGGTSGASA